MASFSFDRVNKLIIVDPSPVTSVTTQEIYDEAQDWLDEPGQLDIQHFIEASGKKPLVGGLYEAISVTLRNDWRVQFVAAAGPTWEPRLVYGGNLVLATPNSYDDNPIAPAAYISTTIAQSTSASLFDPNIAHAVWDAVRASYATAGTFGEAISFLRQIEDGRWKIDTTANTLTLYDTDNTTPIAVFDLKDAAGQPSSTAVFERVPA